MGDDTWTLTIDLATTAHAVAATAVLEDGNRVVTGRAEVHGRVGSDPHRCRAAAVRRSLDDLSAAMRYVYEQPHPAHVDQA